MTKYEYRIVTDTVDPGQSLQDILTHMSGQGWHIHTIYSHGMLHVLMEREITEEKG